MNKYLLWSCVVIVIAVVAGVTTYFSHQRSKHISSDFPYYLPTTDIEELKSKSAHGDCEASTRLAMYYLYGALELETATKYLRVAAKCPGVVPKEYLIHILIHNNDPADAAELNQLIADVRKTDPEKAEELEAQEKNGEIEVTVPRVRVSSAGSKFRSYFRR